MSRTLRERQASRLSSRGGRGRGKGGEGAKKVDEDEVPFGTSGRQEFRMMFFQQSSGITIAISCYRFSDSSTVCFVFRPFSNGQIFLTLGQIFSRNAFQWTKSQLWIRADFRVESQSSFFRSSLGRSSEPRNPELADELLFCYEGKNGVVIWWIYFNEISMIS